MQRERIEAERIDRLKNGQRSSGCLEVVRRETLLSKPMLRAHASVLTFCGTRD